MARFTRIVGLILVSLTVVVVFTSKGRLNKLDEMQYRIFSQNRTEKESPLDQESPPAIMKYLKNFHDDSVARKLEKDVKIVCWINTHRTNLATKARAIQQTWGKRCTKLLFFSDETNSTFPTIGFGTPEGKKYMVPRIFKAFDYVYQHHLQDADWFMRSDDDAFIVMENLRYLLSTYSSRDPWYIGRPFNFASPQGFNSGGAGFVLSKRGLEMLANRPNGLCVTEPPQGGPDDMYLGQCMSKLGVKVGDARDKFGKTRFHTARLEVHVTGERMLRQPVSNDKYGDPVGADTMSQYLISFHHLRAAEMYIFEQLLYRARPYGILEGLHDINVPEDPNKDTKIYKKFTNFILNHSTTTTVKPTTAVKPTTTVKPKATIIPTTRNITTIRKPSNSTRKST